MKTTEQLIKEGAEYFNKCGKHLFEIQNPQGKNQLKHVCLMNKDGEDYRVIIHFYKDDARVSVEAIKLGYMPRHKAEYSQRYFPEYQKVKAVKQNKYLKKILEDIKAEAWKSITDDNRQNYFTFDRQVEIEKSGV